MTIRHLRQREDWSIPDELLLAEPWVVWLEAYSHVIAAVVWIAVILGVCWVVMR